MADKKELSVDELRQLLYTQKQAKRHQRLQRMKDEGRLIEVDTPAITPPPIARAEAAPTGAMLSYSLTSSEKEIAAPPKEKTQWRWIANKLLLLVEIGAVLGLIYILFGIWDTNRELNQELAQVQQAESASVALPTPTATPVMDVVVLPSGHKPPVNGRSPEQGEAGDIPAHLQPAINQYAPPPIPTPGPEQPRRIQIPAIDVDNVIVQGDDWDQLKKGVGQHIGSALPGQNGNIVLSAHNDIFGEIFRYLDKLSPGDEIIVSTERQQYTYIVNKIKVVDPTDVGVMAPTEHASTTLISCYPYQINNKRIVVFADLATNGETQ